MADEITVSFNLQIANEDYVDSIQPGTLQIDQAAIGRQGVVTTVGTGASTVVYAPAAGDIVTEGMAYLRNLDDTNYCTFGPADGIDEVTIGKLKPGEYAFFRLDASIDGIMATADTAAIELDVRIFSD